ncbi:MAG: RNA polymerase sigma factor [Marmoricola sp.]
MTDESFEQFVHRSTPRLLRVAGPLCPQRADAEDLVQDVLIRIARYWGKVSGASSPDAYVTRVLINEASRRATASFRRREAIRDDGLSGTPDELAKQKFLQIEDRADIRQLLRGLSADQRAALVLYYVDDTPYDAIAALLGCREATARSHVRRGLAALRRNETDLTSSTQRQEYQ